MRPGKKIYFLSDFHLGIPDAASSLAREKRIVAFLEEASKDAEEILLLGDLFDFWFEYKHAVPRGHVRLLGKLAELTDRGLPVHLFIGNHDMWIFDYVPKETGVILHREPIMREWNGKKFLLTSAWACTTTTSLHNAPNGLLHRCMRWVVISSSEVRAFNITWTDYRAGSSRISVSH